MAMSIPVIYARVNDISTLGLFAALHEHIVKRISALISGLIGTDFRAREAIILRQVS
jgi:hypothetical protein